MQSVLNERNKLLCVSTKHIGNLMKKSRFTEPQIAYALRQADSGTPVVDICPHLGISPATFYVWKTKYGSLGA
jgi:transposase-like protein